MVKDVDVIEVSGISGWWGSFQIRRCNIYFETDRLENVAYKKKLRKYHAKHDSQLQIVKQHSPAPCSQNRRDMTMYMYKNNIKQTTVTLCT